MSYFVQRSLVCQDQHFCFRETDYLAGTAKPPSLRDLERPKPVLHSVFYDCLHHPLLFRLGGAVKAGEEEADLATMFVK